MREMLTNKVERPAATGAMIATGARKPGNNRLVCARRLGLVTHQTFNSSKSFSGLPKPFESRRGMVTWHGLQYISVSTGLEQYHSCRPQSKYPRPLKAACRPVSEKSRLATACHHAPD